MEKKIKNVLNFDKGILDIVDILDGHSFYFHLTFTHNYIGT